MSLLYNYSGFQLEQCANRLFKPGHSFDDKKGNTYLHLAAQYGFITFGMKLIENNRTHQILYTKNENGKIPLVLSIQKRHDKFSVMLIKEMKPER